MIPTFRPRNSCIAICLFVSGWWYSRTFRPWTHTSDDSYIYQLLLVVATATVSLYRKWLRLLATVPSSTQHFLPLPRSSSWHSLTSSNIALRLFLFLWSRSRYRFQVSRVRAFSVCTLCSTVVDVLTLTHCHNAVRGHRAGSHNSGAEDYLRRKIILLVVH